MGNHFPKSKEQDKSRLHGRLWQVMTGWETSAIAIRQRLSEVYQQFMADGRFLTKQRFHISKPSLRIKK